MHNEQGVRTMVTALVLLLLDPAQPREIVSTERCEAAAPPHLDRAKELLLDHAEVESPRRCFAHSGLAEVDGLQFFIFNGEILRKMRSFRST